MYNININVISNAMCVIYCVSKYKYVLSVCVCVNTIQYIIINVI